MRKTGKSESKASRSDPCGTLSSRTMIVIRIAITPSLKASSRALLIAARLHRWPASGRCELAERGAVALPEGAKDPLGQRCYGDGCVPGQGPATRCENRIGGARVVTV